MKNVIVLVTALLASQGLQAADIARDIRNDEPGNESFLELGFGFFAGQLPLVGFNDQEAEDSGDLQLSIHIGLQARLEYRGFFAEIIEDSFSDITLGYNAYATDEMGIDIVATTMFDDIERDEYIGFESVTDREGDISLGVRSNHYFGDNQVQLELLRDVGGEHEGVVAAAQFGRKFQYRNWNLHGLAGVRYFSKRVIQHYFNVSDEESSATLTAYKADDGFLPTLQIGATLPINEKWIFRTGAEYSLLPKSVSDSPLAQGDDMYTVQAGFYRVFQSG